MRVLVTRPEPDGLKLKGLIEERGHDAEVEPLMHARFDGDPPVDLEGVTALIASSRHALRAIRDRISTAEARRLRIYTVGGGTAEEARRLGFGTIIKGPGTAAALVQVVASTLEPSDELVLNLRGEKVSVNMRGELEALGFRVLDAVVYRMVAADALSESVQEQLGGGEIDAVMLMSQQTAIIYARLIARHRLLQPVRRITHLCLSEDIANRLKSQMDVPCEVAEQPSLEEMLALLDLAAAQSSE
jgi:uroporphyrinogen-III synthase